jgi:SAM-dependent methyltransferase
MTMAIANVEMAQAWDGEEGAHWAANADQYESTGIRIQRRFDEAELIAPTDRVLDVGCGTGKSSRDAARVATQGSVLGVDLSSQMLEVARARSRGEGLTNVEFEQADAQVHPFPSESFDVAISSFGCMFFTDPVAAFRNIASALRPDAGLGLLAWRALAENEWLQVVRGALAMGRDLPSPPPNVPSPFAFADADYTRRVLEDGGFDNVVLTPIDESVSVGADADAAFSFFAATGVARGLTQDLDEPTRGEAFAKLRQAFVDYETSEGVLIPSAAWLITATRG